MLTKNKKEKKAQLWVSTVLYTLIGLTVISMLLLAAKPKIEQSRDNFIIQYMLNTMESFYSELYATSISPGASRQFFITIHKGVLSFNTSNDVIMWEMPCSFAYSEPGQILKVGHITVLTENKTGYTVKAWLNLTNLINITFNANDNIVQTFGKAPRPYELWLKNNGTMVVDIQWAG